MTSVSSQLRDGDLTISTANAEAWNESALSRWHALEPPGGYCGCINSPGAPHAVSAEIEDLMALCSFAMVPDLIVFPSYTENRL